MNGKAREQGGILKSATGIQGLDEITQGGLPQGRATLVCGGAGCGKTLLGIEYLVRGAREFGEPGVFMAFEETADELSANARSLGFDLEELVASGKLVIDHIHLDHTEIEETGAFDLEGLFVRLHHAVESVGAKRVVLDTVEALFGCLSDRFTLRSEITRLFRWCKERGLTVVITAERGDGSLTRHGLEEYISDCVILLDHRVTEQVSTRRLRIVKYRGSAHGTNEFPFLIHDQGISVIPVTSMGLDHPAANERVSSGIAGLDEMLSGKGYFRGTSVLVSGAAGTGKTSVAAHFATAICEGGARCAFFSFEESQQQLVRNMTSIGLELSPWLERRRLSIHSARPTRHGLEMHLALVHKMVMDESPDAVVIDPISSFTAAGTRGDAAVMLLRLVDFLKSRNITALLTSLKTDEAIEDTDLGISSIIDTWICLRDREQDGERHGSLFILKSRGMPHSKQVRDLRLTDNGIELIPRSSTARVARPS